MRPPTLRERQRQLREGAILDAAHELMAEQGYADMSMDALAVRVGVSKATLYQHFPSKEELAIDVIIRLMRRGEECVYSLDPSAPAISRLEESLRQGIERRAALWAARLTLLPTSVRCHPRYQAQQERLVTAFSTLVDAAKAEGDIAPELPTAVIVRLLFCLLRGDYEDLLTSGECSLADLSATLVSIIFDGIRSNKVAPQRDHGPVILD